MLMLAITLAITEKYLMPQHVTMADVAREAGVSLMTVSRVVNNKGELSESTRLRVQEVIDRLGYRPSDIARGLVTDRTCTIGLVVPDNSNPYFSDVARGVEHVAYAEGYNVFLCNTEENEQREIAVLQSLEEKRVDGVVLCSSRLNDDKLKTALAHHGAVVMVNRKIDQNGLGMLLVDDENGGLMAMQHLIQRGHRKIGFIAGPQKSYGGQQRAKGFRLALDKAGIPFQPDWERHCGPVVESGREAAYDLLSSHPELTAIACFNDLNAVGALQACVQLGIRVPDDIAIVGYDDIPLASLVTPALTTCRVPTYHLGQQAMRLLLAHISDNSATHENILVRPELIVRASAP
jgi:LacI family transcriptional regulator